MKAFTRWSRSVAFGVALGFGATAGHATVVERVVAVVGEQAILLSDLRERAKPFLARIEQQSPNEAQRAGATSTLYGALIEKLIEEDLEQRAANRANLTVTPREVDDALGRIATQNGVSVERVMDEATKSGLTEERYRQEIHRQLLEAKLMNLRIQGRMRVTDEDVHMAYQRLVLDERKQLAFHAAWIRVSAARSLAPDALKARRAEVDRIVDAARRGEDFGLLARKYSQDTATSARGGVLPELKPGQLPTALDDVALSMEPGAISEPIRQGDDFVILKLISRDPSQLPPFAESREELSQRVYADKMAKARHHWLEGLRRQTHVEVRL